MKRSKFEERVEAILVSEAVGIRKESIVHEIALPVRVSHELRKYMDTPCSAAGSCSPPHYEFQVSDKIELRVDMGIAIAGAGGSLLLIEVDGGQHALGGMRGAGGVRGAGGMHGGPSPSGSLFARRPAELFRALKRDALKHQLLSTVQSAHPGRVAFLRIGPEFERTSSRHALVSHLASFLPNASPSPALFASCTPPLCLLAGTVTPCPTLPAHPPQSPSPRNRKRARSLGEARPKDARSEMPRTKIRTCFNRYCKGRVDKEMSGEAKAEMMHLIKERQIASDSRKRPRDDSMFAYDPRWFKLADQWWQKQAAKRG